MQSIIKLSLKFVVQLMGISGSSPSHHQRSPYCFIESQQKSGPISSGQSPSLQLAQAPKNITHQVSPNVLQKFLFLNITHSKLKNKGALA